MSRTSSTLCAVVIGLSLSFAAVGGVAAQDDDGQKNACFVACGMVSKGCMAGVRGDRSECKAACRANGHGRRHGQCIRNCAHLHKGPKQECKIVRDRCRSECDHPNACHFGCAADGRECFNMAQDIDRACRIDCRTTAAAAEAACAMAANPEACLEAVAATRAACLDECGVDQGAALAACGATFEACKEACPDDPDSPAGDESANADDDD